MVHLPGRSRVVRNSNIYSLRRSVSVVSPKSFLLHPNTNWTPPLSSRVRHPQIPGPQRPRPFLSASGLSPVIRPRTRFRPCGVSVPGSLPRFLAPAGLLGWPGCAQPRRVSGLPRPTPAAPCPRLPWPALPPGRAVLATPWSPSVTTRCTSLPCRCRRAQSWRGTRAGTGRYPGATISTWGRLSASCWCCAAGAARAPAPGVAWAWAPMGPGRSWQPLWPPWPRLAPEAGRPGVVAPATWIPNPQGAEILAVGGCFEAAAPFSLTALALLPQGERPR